MTIGERIKSARLKKGLTQEELGKMLGVQRAAINKYEKGTVTKFDRVAIGRLAMALDVSPSWLQCKDDYDFYSAEIEDAECKIAALGYSLSELDGEARREQEDAIAIQEELLEDMIFARNIGYDPSTMRERRPETFRTEDEAELLSTFRRLNDQGQKQVLDYAEYISSKPENLAGDNSVQAV